MAPITKADIVAKVKLPIKYCVIFVLISSKFVSLKSTRTMGLSTNRAPIFKEPNMIKGIIGGTLTLELPNANALFSLSATAKKSTITV